VKGLRKKKRSPIAEFHWTLEESGAAQANHVTVAPDLCERDREYPDKVDVYSYAVCFYLLFAQVTELDDIPGCTIPSADAMMRRLLRAALCADAGDSAVLLGTDHGVLVSGAAPSAFVH
jgi:hypothetical protein